MVPTLVPNPGANDERPSSASAGRLTSARKLADCGGDRQRVSLSKQQHVLKPLPRSQPGSVYSKKMALVCKPSSSSRKMRAKKKRAGATVGKYGGQPAVRLMLPWWHHSAKKRAGTEEVDISPEGETCQDADAASYDTPESANGVEAQSPTQQSTWPASPESTSTYPAEGNVQRDRCDSGGGTVNPQPRGRQVLVGETESDEQQGANEYTHYSHLFENPPPSIPMVDQYIFDDNILYDAITKRGNRKALPLDPSGAGVIGIQECVDAPWAPARVGSSGVDELETYVGPQDLLYADEDIDKV